jgi:hypothetical protein
VFGPEVGTTCPVGQVGGGGGLGIIG